MLSEPEIYVYAKWFLDRRGWTLVGGEPPGGTDALPRIEAKDPSHAEKGSAGSKKVDLIAYRGGDLLLLELKPTFHRSDVVKLNELVETRKWRVAFLESCEERNAFSRAGIADGDVRDAILSGEALVKGIGLGEYHDLPDDYLLTVVRGERDVEVHAGPDCSLSRSDFAGED